MLKNTDFKVGDKIIDCGRVYRIFKVEEETIYFKPHYTIKESRDCVCSIPLQNLHLTKIRRPYKPETMEKLYDRLTSDKHVEKPVNLDKAKEELRKNNLKNLIKIMKGLWAEKYDEEITFTKSRKDMLSQSLRRMSEEFALINKIKISDAEVEIEKTLDKWISTWEEPAPVIDPIAN